MFGLVHAASISRLAPVAGSTNGRKAVQQVYSGVACLFIPMNHRTAIENKFSIGRAYDCYFNAGQDVKAGDQLTRNGATYTVRSVLPYDVPNVGHVQALVEQEIDP